VASLSDRAAADAVRKRMFSGGTTDRAVLLAELSAELYADCGRLRAQPDAESGRALSCLGVRRVTYDDRRHRAVFHRASDALESWRSRTRNSGVCTG